ncbi:unnamed protein product [Prorocentrum cordatum]|uniref:Uncharacterized protein n=1 Tax=Prorocentrum cordatum TaxID=2364126 RepID=A0ABN9U5J5_9DINO|nr:unnamed protein product [Polarella glacialis]
MVKPSVSFRVHTIKANSWGTMKSLLAGSLAHVVLAQKRRLITKDEIDQASFLCTRRGWKSIWAPPNPTVARGSSGGLAILIRSWAACNTVDQTMAYPDRCVMCEAQMSGAYPIVVAPAYCVHPAGLDDEQIRTLARLGGQPPSGRQPWLRGADFNCEPGELEHHSIAVL